MSNYFRWWKKPTDRFSFLLVVVTFLLFIATVGLYCATRELVHDAAKTSERQLRAYVGIKGVVTISNVVQGGKPIIIAPIGNFGHTPAYKVAYSVDAKVWPQGTKEFPIPTKMPGLRIVNPGNDGFEIKKSVSLTETEMKALESKQAAIYFFGEIVYFDIFSNRTRTTKFRLSHGGELLGSGRMGICEEGNEAD